MNHIRLKDRHLARRAYPHSRVNQRSYLRAVAYLRERSLWIVEGAPARWGHGS